MNSMNPLDIAWLAGMIEGEATIGAWSVPNRNKSFPSKHTKYARVEISSVDYEVIERLHSLTGIGNIHKQISSGTKGKNKACNTWRVAKAEDVLHLLCTVVSYGYFSEHRELQIFAAVEAASETVARKRSGESFSRKKELANVN